MSILKYDLDDDDRIIRGVMKDDEEILKLTYGWRISKTEFDTGNETLSVVIKRIKPQTHINETDVEALIY